MRTHFHQYVASANDTQSNYNSTAASSASDNLAYASLSLLILPLLMLIGCGLMAYRRNKGFHYVSHMTSKISDDSIVDVVTDGEDDRDANGTDSLSLPSPTGSCCVEMPIRRQGMWALPAAGAEGMSAENKQLLDKIQVNLDQIEFECQNEHANWQRFVTTSYTLKVPQQDKDFMEANQVFL